MAAVCRRTYGLVRLTFSFPTCQQKSCQRRFSDKAKVKALGTFEPVQTVDTPYRDGQLFFHKHFCYRGIIVSSWQASGYVRPGRKIETESLPEVTENGKANAAEESKDPSHRMSTTAGEDKERPRRYLFYHALMDTSDTQPNEHSSGAATYLENKKIMNVEGTDLVFHEDIMPFVTSDPNPIENDLMTDLFTRRRSATQFEISKAFNDQEVKKNHHCWLQSKTVYSAVTGSIQVTVIPFYIGSTETDQVVTHNWRYCLRIQNHGTEKLQLRKRNWLIYCGKNVETIRAIGVVGQEPVLSPQKPVFQYCSHVCLESPMGKMWGHFVMETETGENVDCTIPSFILKTKDKDSYY